MRFETRVFIGRLAHRNTAQAETHPARHRATGRGVQFVCPRGRKYCRSIIGIHSASGHDRQAATSLRHELREQGQAVDGLVRLSGSEQAVTSAVYDGLQCLLRLPAEIESPVERHAPATGGRHPAAELCRVDVAVGRKTAHDHPVDTGIDKRVIVSGIAEHYAPEEVVGRQVCVLVNLEPKPLKGIVSQGMILMAENADGSLSFVSPDKEIKPGCDVR